MNESKPILISEYIVLIAAAAMLVGFLALPWTDAYVGGELRTDIPGIDLLLKGRDTELLKPSDRIYGTERPGVAIVEEKSYDLEPVSVITQIGLLLVPLAAVGGGALTWRTGRGAGFVARRETIRQRRVLAALVVLYLALIYPGYAATDLGIWIVAISAAIMLIVAPAADGTFAPWKLDFTNFWR